MVAVVLATLVGGAVVPASGTAPAVGPVVVTSAGRLQGVAVAGVDEFLGVPYAVPPVGELRWRAPEPAARWPGVRTATAFAPHCPQAAAPFSRASSSEDCLYLNVFAPVGHGATRPVMVWIHGGALLNGESDDFDPTALVRDGVLVVTINYRLGALGFLAHPALVTRPGGPSGDYGLMDQQAALRWVQRDIAAFGGDPNDVTLFGESAGGLSVLAQLASPGAHGLFTRALVESGAYDPTQVPLSAAEATGQAFAAGVGCTDQTAACLRKLPVAAILENQPAGGYLPDVDGGVLPQPLSTAFATGAFNRVPVLQGSNHDEYRMFVAQNELANQPVTAVSYPFMIAGLLGYRDTIIGSSTPPDANPVTAQYPLNAFPSPAIAFATIGTDALFACTALAFDDALSRYAPTYAYEFNDENAPQSALPPVSFPYGAEHSAELQYLFNLPGRLSAPQLHLADAMQHDWTGFAATGAPSWPPYNGTGRIQSLTPAGPHTETDFATAHHCAFWNSER